MEHEHKKASELLTTLQHRLDKLREDLAAARAQVAELKAQRAARIKELAQFGITDPDEIPGKLDSFRQEAEKLLQEINEGIPDEFRDDGGSGD